MDGKVLVTFASTHGSTQEVAESMAEILRESGSVVDLLPMRSVQSLHGYSAVVVGAPLYMFHLHKDALRFLSRHRKALSQGLPVAVFAGGPMGEAKPEDWQEVRANLDRELEKFAWLKPVAVELIGGRFDPTKLRFPWNLIPAMRQMPPSDLRDWDAIRAWVNNLPAHFSSASQDRQSLI